MKKKLILGIAMCGCILVGGCSTSGKSVSEIQQESEQEINDFESEEIQVGVETEFTYGEMNEDFYLVIEDIFTLVDRNDVVIVGVNYNSPLYVNTDVDVLSGDERIETRVGGIEIYGETVDAVPEETNVGVLLEGLTKEDIQVGDIIVLRGCNKVMEEETSSVTDNLDCQFTCIEVEGEYEVTLYDKSGNKIDSWIYPKEPWVKEVNENILEIGISVGTPARYTFYFDKESCQISDTYFNPILFGNKYIAYMENCEELILTDIFNEGILYKKIVRDFTQSANPIDAVTIIEMMDDEKILLEYFEGDDFAERKEIISL